MTVSECLFRFKGRMRRKDYWLKGMLVVAPPSLLLFGVVETVSVTEALYWMLAIPSVAILYMSAALIVKRLHDRDRSGWFVTVPLVTPLLQAVLEAFQEVLREDPLFYDWLQDATSVLVFVTLVAHIWNLFILIPVAFFRGTVGPNRFGDDPLGVKSRLSDQREVLKRFGTKLESEARQ
jgi:uncharacterized membrane protein YhaH (DUF805 family)